MVLVAAAIRSLPRRMQGSFDIYGVMISHLVFW